MTSNKPSVRDRVLQTALGLFATQGIRATGIDRIIADSGVAKASFYRHFPSKNDLILACLQIWHETHFSALRQKCEESDDKTRPLAFFDVLGEQENRPGYRGDLLITALIESGADRSPVTAFIAAARQDMRQWFEELLAAAGFADMAESLSHEWLMLYEGAMLAGLRAPQDYPARRARATAERSLQQIQLKRLFSKALPQ